MDSLFFHHFTHFTSLHSLTSLTTSWVGGRQRRSRVARTTRPLAQHVQDQGTARARLAWTLTFPKEIHLNFFHENLKIVLQIPYGGSDTFVLIFQKIVLHMGILIFVRSTLQLVENIKPIRQLLCTFSSCSHIGIYIIYNIYKFQENQRTKKASLFTSLTHSLTSQLTWRSRTSYLANDD